jgi:hypothetical protein
MYDELLDLVYRHARARDQASFGRIPFPTLDRAGHPQIAT